MANEYSLPPWLIPQRAPWEALVAGVQAGSAIAANRQRARSLNAEIQRQAFRDKILTAKQAAEDSDRALIGQWMPQFQQSTGENVPDPPAISDASMLNRLQMMVMDKRQKYAAYKFSSGMSGLNLETPEGQKDYYDLVGSVSKYGLPMTIEQIQAPIFKAQELKRLRDAATAQVNRTPQKVNMEEANRLRREADAVEFESPEEAAELRRQAGLFESTLLTGVTKDPSAPTAATTSQIQQRMLTADKTLELGAQLMSRLTESDVGVRGNLNQVIVNEGLSQILPALNKGSVTEARTMLGQFNEAAIKAIASDPRISDKDRDRYERILPSLGNIESLKSAKDKIQTFMDKFRDQSRTDAKAAGLPIPNWTLSADEIKAKVKSGEMPYDEGLQLLMKYHP